MENGVVPACGLAGGEKIEALPQDPITLHHNPPQYAGRRDLEGRRRLSTPTCFVPAESRVRPSSVRWSPWPSVVDEGRERPRDHGHAGRQSLRESRPAAHQRGMRVRRRRARVCPAEWTSSNAKRSPATFTKRPATTPPTAPARPTSIDRRRAARTSY